MHNYHLLVQDIVDEAKATVVDAVQWSVRSGYGCHLVLDFWSYKFWRLLAVLVTCCHKGEDGMYTKETYVAGLFDVSKVRHTSELVIQKLQETLTFLCITEDDVVTITADGGLSVL